MRNSEQTGCFTVCQSHLFHLFTTPVEVYNMNLCNMFVLQVCFLNKWLMTCDRGNHCRLRVTSVPPSSSGTSESLCNISEYK